jgi:hypothetical protein
LHLDQHLGPGEGGDGDERAGREVVAENLLAQFDKAVAQTRVGDEDGHRHHVGGRRPGLFEGTPEAG